MSNLLFICSKNQWRSPTAELIFKNHRVHDARSAGTSDKARIRVNEKLLFWADVVLVMERRHKQILQQRFPDILNQKAVINLDIADEYRFGDEDLIEVLKDKLTDYL